MPRAKPRPLELADPVHTPPLSGDLAATQVLRQFRSIFSAVRTQFREIEKRTGVGGAQVWALKTIKEQPGLGVGDLAAAMDIHQSTASNLVRGLLARGLVSSQQGALDRRSVHLKILPPGRAVLRKVPGPATGILPKALSELDHATLGRLHGDLALLLQRIGPEDDSAQKLLAQM